MTKRQQQQNLSLSQDGGYTIIESLVAMVVVSVLMIAIAPVMAFSVATRVQARRTELATQAARTYIDGLRTGAIKPPNNPQPTGFPVKGDISAPNLPNNVNALYCVNFDSTPDCQNTSNKDFLVQGIWDVGPVTLANPNNPTPVGYNLIVRVYRADSFAPGVALRDPRNSKQSVVGGLGDRTIPVVEMSTQIPPTSGGGSAYSSLCDRTKGCKKTTP
ncbi:MULTISPECIES: hormogonium polysaccharide secretion pseudopilin HpsB [unclassified Microcoleus]|uniref:hormogonium polysaccharide secretion pseudopilin HpsB n=1 Tax=unclassified Microcoleus TaxID=2642155 RepID=UPI001DB19634|nr:MULTISPECIES: hormogonium polysaccharide secretion pseudopilin HpsB [unclassified Microcoleus]MCC3476002.1 type II secretion system protein [Microcoleus sp. PH2017_13_LAR_U_A]MCC3487503.1 type II secretion system protein [Microcoleus sp. PH2017_14_LAR_D_A]TAE06609.1 MAG: type II secretion system protein [Oscillatoriales cyanobacterium]TAE21170.1 MAG: type II secretion system protein [Oscillatoriales cyanobacterium]